MTTTTNYAAVAATRTTSELTLAAKYSDRPAIRRAALNELLDRIADMIRAADLDGPDIHDIAASVDAGELDYTGAGENLHSYLLDVTDVLDLSASDLLDEATRTVLGW
jgi:hypothetical protein